MRKQLICGIECFLIGFWLRFFVAWILGCLSAIFSFVLVDTRFPTERILEQALVIVAYLLYGDFIVCGRVYADATAGTDNVIVPLCCWFLCITNCLYGALWVTIKQWLHRLRSFCVSPASLQH
jgi:hypothetical protein